MLVGIALAVCAFVVNQHRAAALGGFPCVGVATRGMDTPVPDPQSGTEVDQDIGRTLHGRPDDRMRTKRTTARADGEGFTPNRPCGGMVFLLLFTVAGMERSGIRDVNPGFRCASSKLRAIILEERSNGSPSFQPLFNQCVHIQGIFLSARGFFVLNQIVEAEDGD